MRVVDDLGEARYAELEFNAPMSSARARELGASLQPLAGASIVDLGCGWAELLLRLLADEPTARGVGVDSDAALLARAERNAEARGLADRLHLECANAADWSGHADVAVVIGASHAFGGTRATLDAVHRVLEPGGRLLFGEGIWGKSPTSDALAGLNAQTGDLSTLAELIDLCIECNYGVLATSTATLDEWDAFESGFLAGRERWLERNPDALNAADVRAEVEAHRDGYLHGYRGILGFAYVTLGVASKPDSKRTR
jgi:SAM-dependent methyltransferase